MRLRAVTRPRSPNWSTCTTGDDRLALHARAQPAPSPKGAQEAWLGRRTRFEAGRLTGPGVPHRDQPGRSAMASGNAALCRSASDELERSDGRFSQDGWWVRPDALGGRVSRQGSQEPALVARVQGVIADLPPFAASVVTLAMFDGLTSARLQVLDITEVNQRVRLHRARTTAPVGSGGGGSA